MEGERVFVNHRGQLYFQLLNPYKTTCSNPSTCVYDDDINMDMDEDDSSPQGESTGGGKGGSRCSGSAPPEEMLEPPMTRSRSAVGSFGFSKAHFYQYSDDHFSRLKLRLDAIDERQQQHAQAQKELLKWQMDFDHR